jgi:hypothetical protein
MHGNHPQTVTLVLANVTRHIRPFANVTPSQSALRMWPGMAPRKHPHTPTGSIPVAHTQNRSPSARPGSLPGGRRVDWTTWWPWRGAYTRSHPELGREIPQRPWYCVLRHGRVGRRQVFQSTPKPTPPILRGTYHHQRGVEQPGSSSGS